jgi:hypothetical protein
VPSTPPDYSGDWVVFDDVVDALHVPYEDGGREEQTVKVRPLSRTGSDYREFARAIELSVNDRLIIVWANEAVGLVIEAEDRLTFTDVSGVESSWRIGNATLTNRGYWVVAASKIATNAN